MKPPMLALSHIIILAIAQAAPLTELNEAGLVSFRNEIIENSLVDEKQGHRQKRQLSTLAWSPTDFFQGLGQTLSSAASQIRGIFGNGIGIDPESPIVRMVSDFGERVTPVILRTIYTGAVQQAWEQVLKRARTTANEFFDMFANADT